MLAVVLEDGRRVELDVRTSEILRVLIESLPHISDLNECRLLIDLKGYRVHELTISYKPPLRSVTKHRGQSERRRLE